jgi:protein O-GlcNAc transferase
MTLSFDVLRMSRSPVDGEPIFTASDMANTQIVVLDNRLDGPYWNLWRLFANKPILRLSNLTETTPIDNIIIPLAGGSNPILQGDWEVQSCRVSELLRTFVARVLSFYHVEARPSHEAIAVTFIDRHEGRRLVNQTRLLAQAAAIPHVRIRWVDFAALSFKAQIQAVRDADVLIGVHGAGLTHALWPKPGMAVAEVLPHGLAHKGFRNLAQLLGLGYFSLHAAEEEVPWKDGKRLKRDKWHTHDVLVEEDRWLRLVRAAVADVYNKRDRNFDVAKR